MKIKFVNLLYNKTLFFGHMRFDFMGWQNTMIFFNDFSKYFLYECYLLWCFYCRWCISDISFQKDFNNFTKLLDWAYPDCVIDSAVLPIRLPIWYQKKNSKPKFGTQPFQIKPFIYLPNNFSQGFLQEKRQKEFQHFLKLKICPPNGSLL